MPISQNGQRHSNNSSANYISDSHIRLFTKIIYKCLRIKTICPKFWNKDKKAFWSSYIVTSLKQKTLLNNRLSLQRLHKKNLWKIKNIYIWKLFEKAGLNFSLIFFETVFRGAEKKTDYAAPKLQFATMHYLILNKSISTSIFCRQLIKLLVGINLCLRAIFLQNPLMQGCTSKKTRLPIFLLVSLAWQGIE